MLQKYHLYTHQCVEFVGETKDYQRKYWLSRLSCSHQHQVISINSDTVQTESTALCKRQLWWLNASLLWWCFHPAGRVRGGSSGSVDLAAFPRSDKKHTGSSQLFAECLKDLLLSNEFWHIRDALFLSHRCRSLRCSAERDGGRRRAFSCGSASSALAMYLYCVTISVAQT